MHFSTSELYVSLFHLVIPDSLFSFFISIFFSFAANAGSDGENVLSKNKPESVKDCFEPLNRGIFAFNQFLDGAIFEPVANVIDAETNSV